MNRLNHIDGLRGLAAVAVMIYHFTTQLPDGFLRHWGSYGWLGVEVFFVISGAVIPLACRSDLSGYARVGGFLLRRMARLFPPFAASILLVLLLAQLSALVPGYAGHLQVPSWRNLVANLCYVADFTGEPWISPVYWTLALEVQWYLFLALLGPLMLRHKWLAWALLMTLPWLLPSDKLALHWLPLFGCGWVASQRLRSQLNDPEFLLQALSLLVLTALVLGTPQAAAALLAMTAILGLEPVLARLQSWGGPSYSLYLVHVPVGGRIINLAKRLDLGHPVLQWLAVLAASLVSVLFSLCWSRWLEQPAIRLSRRLRA